MVSGPTTGHVQAHGPLAKNEWGFVTIQTKNGTSRTNMNAANRRRFRALLRSHQFSFATHSTYTACRALSAFSIRALDGYRIELIGRG